MSTPTVVLTGLTDVLVRLRADRGLRSIGNLARGKSPRPDSTSRLFETERVLAFRSGQLSPRQFLLGLAQAYQWPDASYDALAAAWTDALEPNAGVAALFEAALDHGHPVYLFGGTDPLHFQRARELLPALRRFTGLYPTFEAGCSPESLEFYRRGCERFGLAPANCVCVDVDPRAVDAASQAGVPGMIFTGDVNELRSFLGRWGVAV